MRALEGETYRSPRVLVVEDEPRIARGLQSALTELGFNEVYLAHDLLMGQALLLLRPLKLGILDVQIGRDRVFPLAAEFRAKLIPIIGRRRGEQTAARMVNQEATSAAADRLRGKNSPLAGQGVGRQPKGGRASLPRSCSVLSNCSSVDLQDFATWCRGTD